jgi:transposase-like protein
MVARQARSGLCVRAWCRQHGQREPAFHWWRRELRRRDAEGPRRRGRLSVTPRAAHPPRSHFAPIHIRADAAARADGRIEIVLAGDLCVRVSGRIERQALADVLAVLDERSRSAQARPEPESVAC